jgi:hypothetical protein
MAHLLYVLYDVDPSERFNARRNMVQRIVPLVHSLAKRKQVTLVLAPFPKTVAGNEVWEPWHAFFEMQVTTNSKNTGHCQVELWLTGHSHTAVPTYTSYRCTHVL